MAAGALAQVTAPVLMLVGELDQTVIELNQEAMALLPENIEKKLEIIPGATYLFEEPGTLELVAARARDWFRQFLLAKSSRPGGGQV